MSVDVIGGEPAYEVEEILDCRGGNGGHWQRREFLVKWKNFGPEEDSWEPRENLNACPDALKTFLLSRGIMDDKLTRKRRRATSKGFGRDRKKRRLAAATDPDDLKTEPSAVNVLASQIGVRLPSNTIPMAYSRPAASCCSEASSSRNDENATPEELKQEEQEVDLDDEGEAIIEKIRRDRKRKAKASVADEDIDRTIGITPPQGSDLQSVQGDNLERVVLQDVDRNLENPRTNSRPSSTEGASGEERSTALRPTTSREPSEALDSSNGRELTSTISSSNPNRLVLRWTRADAIPTNPLSKARDKQPSVDSGFRTASSSPTFTSTEEARQSSSVISTPKIPMVSRSPIKKKKKVKGPKSSWASTLMQQLENLAPMDEYIKNNSELGTAKEKEKVKEPQEGSRKRQTAIRTPNQTGFRTMVPPPSSGTSSIGKLAYYSLFNVSNDFPYRPEPSNKTYRFGRKEERECESLIGNKLRYTHIPFVKPEEEDERKFDALEDLDLAIKLMSFYRNARRTSFTQR